MAINDVDYTSKDLKQAITALLPPGEYWQYENGDDLDLLLSAMGDEFKTIHDETKVSALNQTDNNTSGWKISDYQTILNDNYIAATVYDKPDTPNLIYIEMSANQTAGGVIKSLDSYRLPHTALCSVFTHQKTLHIALARRSLTVNRRTLKAAQ